MPTYQYACTDCGDRSEVVQRFTDDPLTVCSACGGKLRKVFSPVGIVFKGSGFYRTDSRNGSSTVPAGKDGAAQRIRLVRELVRCRLGLGSVESSESSGDIAAARRTRGSPSDSGNVVATPAQSGSSESRLRVRATSQASCVRSWRSTG